MKTSLVLTVFALAVAAISLPPAASGLIPCVLCDPYSSIDERCAGNCNGFQARYCSDWFAYGCTSIDGLFASPVHPLDVLFPTPDYLQQQGATFAPSAPSAPNAGCLR